jgi:DNA ligase (NAD+)
MDIRGVGESVVKDLIKSNLITCIEDLYKLKRYTPEELSNILGEGYGVKSCQNIIKSIEDSKKKTFANVLAGLSIPNVGKVMARLLANTFKNIKNFLNAKLEELLGLEGIGEILANEIYKWINTPNNINMCRNLEQEGLIMEVIEEVKLNNNGLKVCFTGTSNRFTGDNIEKFLEENGFKCSGISKKLDYLIIGEKPGPSKVKKAEEYGVTIISENNFYEKYNL